MKKHLSMCARIVNASKKGFLNRAHGHGKPLLGSLWICFILLSMILFSSQSVVAETSYLPDREDILAGSRIGVYPNCLRANSDSVYCNYWDDGNPDYTASVRFQFWEVPLSRLRLDLRVVSTSGLTLDIRMYNSSSSTWGNLATWDQLWTTTSQSWVNFSTLLLGYWYNDSAPAIALTISGPGPTTYTFSIDYLQIADTFTGTQDDIDELKRELERLKKQTNPDVVTNETELPTIPYRNRGVGDDVEFVDPYRTIVYDVKVSDSGGDLDFYLPRPTTSDEYTIISDEIWIAEKSYDDIWINDTVGATVLLTTSDPVTYYNIEWGYNLSVEVSGTSASVRADRVTTVRLIDSFDWGWNRDTGIFAHRSTIENDIAYNMENVRAYWAFPTEDSDGRDVQIDVASIEVWDDDNNLQLDKGRHYEATEAGGVSLEYRWVNTSGTTASRTIRIQFTRARDVEGVSYYTVYDNDITFSDTYGDSPYTVNVHHTQHGTANFEGMIIIKFSFSGKYSGERLDVNTLKIKRSDSSLFQDYTYDSISNELRITDQTVDAGESITYTLYFDWYDEKSAVYELILGDPLILYSLLLLAGFAGLFIFLDATKEEKRRKYAGIIIIAVDVIILVIVLLA